MWHLAFDQFPLGLSRNFDVADGVNRRPIVEHSIGVTGVGKVAIIHVPLHGFSSFEVQIQSLEWNGVARGQVGIEIVVALILGQVEVICL